VSDRVRVICHAMIFHNNILILAVLRLPSSFAGSHCPDCAVLAEKARRKSLAASASDLSDSAKIRKILELLRKVDERACQM
jgi:hypothetical protein